MIQARGGFRFSAKALQMCVGGPMAEANHFERNSAVQTFLPRAINDTLTATADHLQQFIVAKVGECLWTI